MAEGTGRAGLAEVYGPAGRAAAPPEWWERLSATWRRRLSRSPRLARIIGVAAVVSVLLPLLAVGFVPGFRRGIPVWIACWGMLNAWFAVSYTRTVRWGSVTRLYSLSVVWAAVILWLSARVVAAAGLTPGAAGASVVVAGVVEETFKLAPLAFLALASPGRVRRFNLADWGCCALACGLGFQTAEDFARQASHRPNVLDLVFGNTSLHYGWTLFGGQFDLNGRAAFPGHHITTGLIGVTIGLAAVATRRRWPAWPLAWLAPLAAWVLTVTDHMAFNAVNADPRYAQARSSRLPGVVHLIWSATGRGYGLGWALLVLLVGAVLLDLLLTPRRTPPTRPGLDLDRPEVREQLFRPLDAARAALAVTTGWRPRLATAWLTLEERRQAREVASTTDSGPGRTRTRLASGVGGGVVAVLAAVVAVALARHVGLLVGARSGSAWFLGLLDALSRWWNDLPPGGKFLVVAGGIALLLAPELVIALEVPLALAGGGSTAILITVPATVTTALGEGVLATSAAAAGASIVHSVAASGSGEPPPGTPGEGSTPASAADGVPTSGPRAVPGEWSAGPKPEPPFQSEIDDIVSHAWEKHVELEREFPEVKTPTDFDQVVKETVEHASEWGYRQNGGIYWYDELTNTVVIKNPPGVGGTIYRP